MIFLLFNFIFCVNTSIIAKAYHDKILLIDASGSSRQRINGTKQVTKPEYAIYPWDKNYDWCSNCGRTKKEYPFITFSLQDRRMIFDRYFIRCGCCYKSDCCCDTDYYDYCVDCCLYSWALQISDDNVEWKEVHRVEKERGMRRCNEKSYKLDKSYNAKYVKLVQIQPCLGYPPCMSINRIDFYGDIIGGDDLHQQIEGEDFIPVRDDDEDVSIIGHISKNVKVN